MNKKTKSLISFLGFAAVFAFSFFLLDPHFTLAASNPANAFTESGIGTGSGGADSSELYDSLKNIIYIIIAVGGFWVMACLIFAGMKLSASQGNPQARTAGFVGLAMAAVGLFIIVKAFDIASWIASFGVNS